MKTSIKLSVVLIGFAFFTSCNSPKQTETTTDSDSTEVLEETTNTVDSAAVDTTATHGTDSVQH